jgi:hypothetical protein
MSNLNVQFANLAELATRLMQYAMENQSQNNFSRKIRRWRDGAQWAIQPPAIGGQIARVSPSLSARMVRSTGEM